MAILFLAVLLGTAYADVTLSQGSVSGIFTSLPLDFDGTMTLESDFEAFRAVGEGAVERTLVTADEIVVEVAWQRGVEVRSGTSILKRVVEEGEDIVRLSDVRVDLSAANEEPIVFAHMADGRMQGALQLNGSARVTPGIEETVVSVGSTSDAMGGETRNVPRFWYEVSSDLANVRGQGIFVAQGSFTLFVHDVVVRAHGTDRDWSAWTGYREADPDAPTTEYELRVTTMRVENGTIMSGSPDGLDVYLRQFDSHVEGILTTFGVTGEIDHDGHLHVFAKDSLNARGSGQLMVVHTSPTLGEPERLEIVPSGNFELSGASKMVPVGVESAVTGYNGVLRSIGSAIASILALVGLVALGVVPGPTRGMRSWQTDHWRRRGQIALDRDAGRVASVCYAWSTFIGRKDPLAWYERAYAELERGRPVDAERLALHTMALPDADVLDLLDLRASAAWDRGDHDAFLLHLTALAREAPGMARILVADLGLPWSELTVPVTELLGIAQKSEVLDGYG